MRLFPRSTSGKRDHPNVSPPFLQRARPSRPQEHERQGSEARCQVKGSTTISPSRHSTPTPTTQASRVTWRGLASRPSERKGGWSRAATCARNRRASRIPLPHPLPTLAPRPDAPGSRPLTPPPAERWDSRLQLTQEGACALAPVAERFSPPSASACARSVRGSEPVERKGRGREKARRGGGGLRRRSSGGWNPRGLPPRVRLGAGGKPLALLSRDDGQVLSGCLVHGFLSGARPGSLRRVESPWQILTSGQWVFLCDCALKEPGSQPASQSSSHTPTEKNVLRLMCPSTERPYEDTGRR
ncbi:uncharacterized protein LOC131810506 [Mustela lutreola]|uniref:uncharacterized protein LOC131810506 n=1 Tax=Mustela lutreola TaxID=9666 RepID=UPI002796F369|nr:uncharacterized protein LOC131810506 [Mustela lutreola]